MRTAAWMGVYLGLAACSGQSQGQSPAPALATGAPLALSASFCASAQPMGWSPKDTDETIREIKTYNAVGAKLCGWPL